MIQLLAGHTLEASRPGQKSAYQQQAYAWFFGSNSDFDQWCDDAGFDPAWVRRKARDVLDNGLPKSRAAAGTGKRYAERKRYRERLSLRQKAER